MDYTTLRQHSNPQTAQKEIYPLVEEIEIPSFGNFLKIDLTYHLATGVIFGIGHFLGAYLMRKTLG